METFQKSCHECSQIKLNVQIIFIKSNKSTCRIEHSPSKSKLRNIEENSIQYFQKKSQNYFCLKVFCYLPRRVSVDALDGKKKH